MTEKIQITSLLREELREKLSGLGIAPYRADQIMQWVCVHHARSFDTMTNIAKAERESLSLLFSLSRPRIDRTEHAVDGTRKVLFGLADGHAIESVLIPDDGRLTLCISSQVGCRQACRFCLTGSGGFVRDLRASEIVGQLLEVSRVLKEEGTRAVTNIVLMGMGEPLANFGEVLRALRIITSAVGPGFSPRRVTVSTAGLVPEIGRLGESDAKVNLAVSLNATTDEVRDRIMPVNRSYPIGALLDACRKFPLEPRRRITVEYVLLGGVNDTADDALRLARLIRGIKCKVNLIPFNPFPGSEFKRPGQAAILRFQQILIDRHYTAPVRESRGRDISAACGQLRERQLAAVRVTESG